ncbi:hypothetical protein [Bradyrhizobium diversitatis]|uniref:Uncharacterized protein n=1 Tax=Bradyrhizobium diversitatis TaxID=2755406 RepID=A0ABS0PA56_9BRAD|nr:hypothetical protein [Bradyrhizobium diversitatis]MBH5390068.1 hypothetical protein [Bradyrhizobium diversitatis]
MVLKELDLDPDDGSSAAPRSLRAAAAAQRNPSSPDGLHSEGDRVKLDWPIDGVLALIETRSPIELGGRHPQPAFVVYPHRIHPCQARIGNQRRYLADIVAKVS